MSFIAMYNELTGCIPKLPVSYAKTLINRAWRDIRRKNLWSFQLYESNWVSPNLVNAGMATVTRGINTVTFDVTLGSPAVAALNALPGPFPTPLLQRQFRVGNSTIYNIFAYSFNSGTGVATITLDRPYTDASGVTGYMIYQCYYPAPFQDHLTFMNVRDIVNFNDLVLDSNRTEIDFKDPQRTIFYLPTYAVSYQQYQNPNDPAVSYGTPVYELWGQILYPITYQLYGIRKGTPLVNDTDTLPYAIGEDVVMALSQAYAYAWAEGNKGDMPRNAGADFRFLIGETMANYTRLYREYRRQDRELVDNWWTIRRHHSGLSNIDGYYNSIGSSANPGAPW